MHERGSGPPKFILPRAWKSLTATSTLARALERSKNCRPHLCPHAARVGGVLSYRSVKGSGNTSVVPARLVAYLATSATGTK